jgi:hypothetical protein
MLLPVTQQTVTQQTVTQQTVTQQTVTQQTVTQQIVTQQTVTQQTVTQQTVTQQTVTQQTVTQQTKQVLNPGQKIHRVLKCWAAASLTTPVETHLHLNAPSNSYQPHLHPIRT